MNAYCSKAAVDVEQVAFIFEGHRLRPEQTPEDVDMEEVTPQPPFPTSHFIFQSFDTNTPKLRLELLFHDRGDDTLV